jgi:O-antigen ligase
MEIQTNLIGVVCVFAMILSLYHLFLKHDIIEKIALFFCLLWTTLAALMTQTRSTLLAIILACVVLFGKNKKFILSLLMVLILLSVLTPWKNRFSIDSFLQNERFGINLVSIELIKDHPIFGIGFSMETYADTNFMKTYYDRVPYEKLTSPRRPFQIFQNPNNILFDVAIRTGIIGFCLFCFIIFSFVKMGLKIIRQGKDSFIRGWGLCLFAAFVGYFTQGMFEPVLHGAYAVVLFTIFGMMTILWRLNKMDDRNSNDFESTANGKVF